MKRWAIAASALIVLGVVPAVPAVVWQARGSIEARPVNVSGTATDSLTPVVAVSGEYVHIAWIESEPTTDGLRATIWYVRSTDSGATFETPRPVAPLTGYASALQCIVDGSTVHLAWLATSYTTGTPAAVDYQRSVDGGLTFEPFVAVNSTEPPGAPILIASSGRVATVWQAGERIWMALSVDGGASFDMASAVGANGELVAVTVRAAATLEGIALAWLAPAVDGGLKLGVGCVDWQTGALDESSSPEGLPVADIAATAFGDNVIVAWTTSTSVRTAKSARSSDGGVSYSGPDILGDASAIGAPRASAGADVAFVTWVDPLGRLRISRIGADGSIGEIRVRMNKRAVFPEIAGDGESAVVAWRSGSGSGSLIRSCVIDSTRDVASVRRVTGRGGSAVAPRLAADGLHRIVVWQQLIGGTAEVFAMQLPD